MPGRPLAGLPGIVLYADLAVAAAPPLFAPPRAPPWLAPLRRGSSRRPARRRGG